MLAAVDVGAGVGVSALDGEGVDVGVGVPVPATVLTAVDTGVGADVSALVARGVGVGMGASVLASADVGRGVEVGGAAPCARVGVAVTALARFRIGAGVDRRRGVVVAVRGTTVARVVAGGVELSSDWNCPATARPTMPTARTASSRVHGPILDRERPGGDSGLACRCAAPGAVRADRGAASEVRSPASGRGLAVHHMSYARRCSALDRISKAALSRTMRAASGSALLSG